MESNEIKPEDIFSCKMCGDCCNGYGGTYLTHQDIHNISKYIRVSEREFIDTYCDISADRLVITQGEDGKCVFFKSLCTIHPVKPRMCRAWPFIEGVLRDVGNWRLMASACPGVKADIADETIIRCVTTAIKKLNQEMGEHDRNF